jgi:hypothetical protein
MAEQNIWPLTFEKFNCGNDYLTLFLRLRDCSDVFKTRPILHAGMVSKPLEPYHPLAHRSRLPSPSVVMPYKNSSQIVLGDRR